MDWTAWNNRYDDPGDWLLSRLRIVQQQLADALSERPPGPVQLISVCAGQGRDVIGVLTGHIRSEDVSALLVDLDQATVDTGRARAAAAGLTGVRFAVGNAARTDLYRDLVPADVVLVCGVFGNITADDIEATIGLLPQLCAPGAAVIWTRGRRDTTADLVPAIEGWLTQAGFIERELNRSPAGFTVGRHEYTGPTQPLADGQSMFTFRGYDQFPGSTSGGLTGAAPVNDGPVTIRAATAGDLDVLIELAAAVRDDQAAQQPVFWRPAEDARDQHRPFLTAQIADDNVISLVATNHDTVVGFAVGVLHPAPPVYDPGGPTCTVDDFTVDHPNRWTTTGAALLHAMRSQAAERGAVQVVVVVGNHDHAKQAALAEAGLTAASQWWTGPTSTSP